MPLSGMHMKIILPFQEVADRRNVQRIVVETRSGSFGILPRRRDCVAALLPGILIFETQEDGEEYAAVDEGLLTKSGRLVLVAVRNAILGKELAGLRRAVERDFLQLNEQERDMRQTLARIESGFIRRMARYHHDR